MPWQVIFIVAFLGVVLVEKALMLLMSFSGGVVVGAFLTGWVLWLILKRKRDGVRIGRVLMILSAIVNAGLAIALFSGVLPIERELVMLSGIEAAVVGSLSIVTFLLMRHESVQGWCYRE